MMSIVFWTGCARLGLAAGVLAVEQWRDAEGPAPTSTMPAGKGEAP